MSTPSLLNIPYVIKAGTLYSQIPETGAGDFAVTRTTSPANNRSTRINADGFIELVNDNVPRLDYPLGGAVNGCAALLVEPSAQNAFIQSQTLFTSHLVQNLTTAGYADVAISPDGTQNAEKFVPNTTNGVHGIADITSQTITSGTTYTFSCFAKSDGGTNFPFIALILDNSTAWGATRNAIFNVVSGTVHGSAPSGVTMRIQNYGNGWYRFSATATAVGSVTGQYQYRIYIPNSSATLSYAAASGNTEGVLVWGAQLEVGSVATSYIPTTTAAITRGADVINKTSIASLIGQTEGTVYLEMQADAAGTGQNFLYVGNNVNDSIVIGKSGANCFFELKVNGTNLISNSSVGLSGTVIKGAIAYANGNYAAYANGNLLASGTTSRTPANALTAIAFSNFINLPTINAPTAIMRVRASALYPNRLTNAQLATLTTP
jgi:hypothetical protein